MRVLFLMLALCVPVFATTYYVDNTQGDASDSNAGTDPLVPWLTIGKCATTITAGDTCEILAGTYTPRITHGTNAGSLGSLITYTSTAGVCNPGDTCPKLMGMTINKNYVTVKGLEFTNNGLTPDAQRTIVITAGSNISFIDNYLHETVHAFEAINVGGGATFARIAGNDITKVGSLTTPFGLLPAIVGSSSGSPTDTLIENNNISYVSDYVNPRGNKWVIRNNTLGPSDELSIIHIDAVQPTSAAQYVLFEGNTSLDNRNFDGSVYQNHIELNEVAGSDNYIFRYNSTCRSPAAWIVTGPDRQFWYNNTVVNAKDYLSPGNVQIGVSATSTGNIARNNIWYGATAIGTDPYSVPGGSVIDRDYDLWFAGGDPAETNDVNADPLFINIAACVVGGIGSFNVNLQSGSPAINAGGPLTTVAAADTGSGTSLVLTDAGPFQPGWSGASADQIAVGTVGNTATVSSIDYSTNTITLASGITRSDNDSVWLYKKSDGLTVLVGTAPDIGANEYGVSGTTGASLRVR